MLGQEATKQVAKVIDNIALALLVAMLAPVFRAVTQNADPSPIEAKCAIIGTLVYLSLEYVAIVILDWLDQQKDKEA